ncbi:hypothetical protein ABZ372_18455 [Streptomyces sp. NPDC005921]
MSENDWTRSAGRGPASIESIRSSTISATFGRSARMLFWVNGPATSLRRRVWSGGSMPTMLSARDASVPYTWRPGVKTSARE